MKKLIPIIFILFALACNKEKSTDVPAVSSENQNWRKVLNIELNTPMKDIWFQSDSVFYIVMDKRIYVTQDGGNLFSTDYLPSPGKMIVFASKDTGFAIGETGIYSTFDKGLSWGQIKYDTTVEGVKNYSIQFLNRETGFACSSLGFLKTTNRGESWHFLRQGIHYNSYFLNDTLGFIIYEDRCLYATSDGKSYQKRANLFSSSLFSSYIHFSDTLKGVVAINNKVMFTNNGGTSFKEPVSGSDLITSMKFRTALEGYLVQGNKILRTLNGGETWTEDFLVGNLDLSVIGFSAKTIWAGGSKSLYQRK